MVIQSNCRHGGAPLTGESWDGVCSRCLLEQALVTSDKPTAEASDQGETETQPSSIIETLGQTIGPYKLLQKIGEGAFGLVYMAEQTKPMRRMVALKIIKPGMDSREVFIRFEAERQALAMMDHNNSTKVFDGGITETGHPYFVMDLVKGIPLTRFCDEQRLSVRKRLLLFAQVCHAVQDAHHKGMTAGQE